VAGLADPDIDIYCSAVAVTGLHALWCSQEERTTGHSELMQLMPWRQKVPASQHCSQDSRFH